ncbi:MAG: TlpA family protein disulfide reductase [Betaproteobacteria bacterium]|nr:MAG: TlpA family protein disulfide reductase [Betaproteobacteria bacterium]
MVGVVVVVAIVAVRHGLFSPRPVPSVAVTTIKGEQVRLGGLKGNVVLVNFWATTCAVCLREMPKLAELFEKYRSRGYRTVAVAMPYDPPNRVHNYVKRYPLPFDVALDADGTVLRAFGDVPGTPTSFLVDTHGNIIRKYLGEPDFADLEARIQSALSAG